MPILAVVLGVVLLAADVPVVGGHGLFATRRVLLRDEGLLVCHHLAQVATTRLNQSRYRRETVTCVDRVFGLRHRRVDRFEVTQEEAGTDTAGRRSRAVSCQYHLLVLGVLGLFVDFLEGTANSLDSVSPYYTCHNS